MSQPSKARFNKVSFKKARAAGMSKGLSKFAAGIKLPSRPRKATDAKQ